MAEWSKAHDWKSCVRHKRTKGSNPFFSAKKYCRKGYVFCSIFLSKSQTWYIITARSVVDIISPLGCISSRISVYLSATWWYAKLRFDDMQFLWNWWYARLRLDLFMTMRYNKPTENPEFDEFSCTQIFDKVYALFKGMYANCIKIGICTQKKTQDWTQIWVFFN